MTIKKKIDASGYRLSETQDDVEIGHAYLYVLKNDLHGEPFGLLEDLFVEPEYRGAGVATRLHQAVCDLARTSSCYKLVATSRDDGTRTAVHAWYGRLGYRDYGTEFRIDVLR